MIIPISNPEDPRIAPFRDIRERDLVGRQGHFIAEGEVVLRVLLASRHRPLALLIAEKRLEPLAPLLTGLPDDTPIYSAQQPVLDAIAGFPLHRGILALAARAPLPDATQLLAGCAPRSIVMVLCGIANHDNMGGLFRNAAAFGVEAVLLDQQCCDPFYRKAIRVSVGGCLRVPFTRWDAGTDILALLAAQGFSAVSLSPRGKMPLARLTRPDRAAVLLGTEGEGLPAALLERSHSVSIPMAAGFDSLNVATTSGIVLHHLACGQL
ncbi:RNA methyltransferase [Telmatospirillum sp.]|uniref:TrmH family RNA methyltransferase n=1 Tax=Telmatospirillum sp. TaxID=2079197 RepID=UPI002847E4EB|nr:RNA methyltransferase [Telmatospirillum sp.]MDR3440927.1 RNA methyltransferase [Telmatospirillum sp.]